MILECEYIPLELQPLWIDMCNLHKMLFMYLYVLLIYIIYHIKIFGVYIPFSPIVKI